MRFGESQSDFKPCGAQKKSFSKADGISLPGSTRTFLSSKVIEERTASWPADKIYRFQTYIDEAEFFFTICRDQIEISGAGSVVDVGSGIGLFGRLLSTLGVRVTCLEPASEGFTDVVEMAEVIQLAWMPHSVEFDFRREELSDFVQHGLRGDFYTCINVIEHVPNYENLLREIIFEVGDSGHAFIVFPNYSFPYEPHFSIPTLGSKTLTEKFLSQSIEANLHHLQNPWQFWANLSWPTYREARRIVRSTGANYRFSRLTFLSYFSRLSDERFLARKGAGFRILRKFGLLSASLGAILPLRLLPVVDLRINPPDIR